MLAVRQLNMVGGGPRGRSGAGISIEGADGSKAVLTAASARSPIQAAPSQSVDEYAQEGEFSRRAITAVCTTVVLYFGSTFVFRAMIRQRLLAVCTSCVRRRSSYFVSIFGSEG